MDVSQRIKETVDSNRVMLFMKGNRDFPQCGFSGRAIQILQALGAEFETADVLMDDEIRQGIKEFSNWPTIPQLYINGEFVGGSDIMMEMYENGELKKALSQTPARRAIFAALFYRLNGHTIGKSSHQGRPGATRRGSHRGCQKCGLAGIDQRPPDRSEPAGGECAPPPGYHDHAGALRPSWGADRGR